MADVVRLVLFSGFAFVVLVLAYKRILPLFSKARSEKNIENKTLVTTTTVTTIREQYITRGDTI